MSTLVVDRERIVGLDMRSERNYMSCRCEWNASLPVMKVEQTRERAVVTVNGTGEAPCHFAGDVIYRAVFPLSPVLPESERRQVKAIISPYVREEEREVLDSLSYELLPEASFAKEMRRQLYKALKVKVPDETLSLIGTVAKRYEESQEEEFVFSLTREYDRPDSFYLNSGSCYWGGDGHHSKSMCHCKQLGVSLFVKLRKETRSSNLRDVYREWDRYTSGPSPLTRSLVIPVEYRKGEMAYQLMPDWEFSLSTRFVVLNSYNARLREDDAYHNIDAYMGKMLSKVMEGGVYGENVKGNSRNERFYMNSFNGRSHIPIVHIAREVPKRVFPLIPSHRDVKTCFR